MFVAPHDNELAFATELATSNNELPPVSATVLVHLPEKARLAGPSVTATIAREALINAIDRSGVFHRFTSTVRHRVALHAENPDSVASSTLALREIQFLTEQRNGYRITRWFHEAIEAEMFANGAPSNRDGFALSQPRFNKHNLSGALVDMNYSDLLKMLSGILEYLGKEKTRLIISGFSELSKHRLRSHREECWDEVVRMRQTQAECGSLEVVLVGDRASVFCEKRGAASYEPMRDWLGLPALGTWFHDASAIRFSAAATESGNDKVREPNVQ